VVGLTALVAAEAWRPVVHPPPKNPDPVAKETSPTDEETQHFLSLAGVTPDQLAATGARGDAALQMEKRARDYISANIALLRLTESRLSAARASRSDTRGPADKAGSDRAFAKAMLERSALVDGIREAARGGISDRASRATASMPGADPLTIPGALPLPTNPMAADDFAARGFGIPDPPDPAAQP
jgi:hypothetical protein